MTEQGIARLRGILRRRRTLVGVTFAAVTVLGLVVVARLPSEYQARTVLRIEDPRPSHDYFMPTVTEPVGERWKSRRLTFVARPLVRDAARAALLLPNETEHDLSEIATRFDAKQEGEDTFILTFTDVDRERAKTFLAALTNLYTSGQAREATERARATANFFTEQVEALRPRVAQAETVVQRFRTSHYGSLPEQVESNLRMLDTSEGEVHGLLSSLDATQARRRQILAEAAAPLVHQEEEIGQALSAARARYLSSSPEIRDLTLELERVRKERLRAASDDAERWARGGTEFHAVEADIGRMRHQVDSLRTRQGELRARVDAAANDGEELARLSVERDVLRDRLPSLVSKQGAAVLAAELEANVAAQARITVIEPAWVTSEPVKPPKAALALAALLVALVLSIGLGALVDGEWRLRPKFDLAAEGGV